MLYIENMDVSIAFKTGKHNNSDCPYAKHDEQLAALIKELNDLDNDYDCNVLLKKTLVLAQELKKKIPSFRACKLMQYFASEQPTKPFTDEERTVFLEKISPVFEEYNDETKCEACRENMLCLVSAPLFAIELMRGELDVSLRTKDVSAEDQEFFNSVFDELDLLNCQALYIQSRARELYYDGLLETAKPE